MYDFEKIYHAASVEEAVCMLQKDENSMIISGGTDVLIKLREGRLTGCSLVSIHDIEELKKRIQKRNSETDEVVEKRIRKAVQELRETFRYQHVVCNDDVDKAVSKITEIILKAVQ